MMTLKPDLPHDPTVVDLDQARAREFLAQIDALQKVAPDPVAFTEALNAELARDAETRALWNSERIATSEAVHAAAADRLTPRILVVGVGGAGGNAVDHMIEGGLAGVDFLIANTDAQHLSGSQCERRLQLGHALTQGLGAGSLPEIGRRAAEESIEDIDAALSQADIVFIAAGMGGGTGTGAAPLIAERARAFGALAVGVVTKPFTFEGRHRMRLADSGVVQMEAAADALLVIPNQNLFLVSEARTTFSDAFGMADAVLHSGVRAITDLITRPGLINLDFADVLSVMTGAGRAMMGTGCARGPDRARDAASEAICNPLLDIASLRGARSALVNVTGGPDMTLLEVDEAASLVADQLDPQADIIFGAAFDAALGDAMRVCVVATGLQAASSEIVPPVADVQILRWRSETVTDGAGVREGVLRPSWDFERDDRVCKARLPAVPDHRATGWSLFRGTAPWEQRIAAKTRDVLWPHDQIAARVQEEAKADAEMEIPSFLRRLIT